MAPINMGYTTELEGIDVAREPAPALRSLTPAERRKREQAVRFATASIGLEGLRLSPQAHAHAQRFVDGEIDSAEFLRGP